MFYNSLKFRKILAVEKFSTNYSLAAKMVKEQMDKKFGAAWHCIIGEGFDGKVE